jgi:hypothetical protein
MQSQDATGGVQIQRSIWGKTIASRPEPWRRSALYAGQRCLLFELVPSDSSRSCNVRDTQLRMSAMQTKKSSFEVSAAVGAVAKMHAPLNNMHIFKTLTA